MKNPCISFYKKKAIILKQQLDKPVLVHIHSKWSYNRSCINNQQLPENISFCLPLSLWSFISN